MFRLITTLGPGVVLTGAVLLGSAAAQGQTSTSYAAIPGQTGGQDMFGTYTVDADWPRDLSTLPGA
ncbi:MAG: hypothetical protein OXF98_14940, partial [Rhodospirillaceae bacterium]|nr:hypothetical protein [Rhodospirillaceae bacterium]